MDNDVTKGYLVTFNDVTDDEETGGASSWEDGQLAFDKATQVLQVLFNGSWSFVSSQTVL